MWYFWTNKSADRQTQAKYLCVILCEILEYRTWVHTNNDEMCFFMSYKLREERPVPAATFLLWLLLLTYYYYYYNVYSYRYLHGASKALWSLAIWRLKILNYGCDLWHHKQSLPEANTGSIFSHSQCDVETSGCTEKKLYSIRTFVCSSLTCAIKNILWLYLVSQREWKDSFVLFSFFSCTLKNMCRK